MPTCCAQGGLYAAMWDRQREATEAEERLRIAREDDELGVVVRRRTPEVAERGDHRARAGDRVARRMSRCG